MSVDCFGRKLAVLVLSTFALASCSPPASTAVPPVAAAALPQAAQSAGPLVTGLPDFTALVERYGPAVVNVQVVEQPTAVQSRSPRGFDSDDPFSEFFRRFGIPNPNGPRGDSQPARGMGSGFIVSADGYIITNAHVVRGATDVTVKMTDRREYPAKVVGIDDRTDVAVIKIDAKNLPTVRLGDPSRLKPGQWVVAIGSPFGMENSVTAGIVSAVSRTLPGDPYVPFIQTDAAVNPGNSGGPLFNLEGEVVGINSQIYSQSGGYMGLSFAIPIDVANNVREQLVKTGKVQRGRIGVEIGTVTAAFAESFGLDSPRGALVNSVVAGGPAARAGLKPGDIIIGVNGKAIDRDIEVPALVSATKPGSKVQLEIWRDRKSRNFTVDVEALTEDNGDAAPSQGGGKAEPSSLGLSVRPLAPEERSQVQTEGSLVVEDVTGPALNAGVRPGDIVLGVAGTNVRTVEELKAAVKRGGKTVALRIQRGDRQVFIPVRTE
ncbi:MAG: DegQ family serine endoprotease [Steroidobacteraceae bacterium]